MFQIFSLLWKQLTKVNSYIFKVSATIWLLEYSQGKSEPVVLQQHEKVTRISWLTLLFLAKANLGVDPMGPVRFVFGNFTYVELRVLGCEFIS